LNFLSPSSKANGFSLEPRANRSSKSPRKQGNSRRFRQILKYPRAAKCRPTFTLGAREKASAIVGSGRPVAQSSIQLQAIIMLAEDALPTSRSARVLPSGRRASTKSIRRSLASLLRDRATVSPRTEREALSAAAQTNSFAIDALGSRAIASARFNARNSAPVLEFSRLGVQSHAFVQGVLEM
jgi:hypothetical protein